MSPGGIALSILGAAVLAGTVTLSERVVSRTARKDRVTVIYWEKWTGAEADEMRKVVNAFNESQDGIFVKYLSISGVDQKTLLATSGGNPPDVAGIWQQQVFQFADAGALTELTPMSTPAGLTRDYYISAYYDSLSANGKLWAVPSTPASVALYVRPDLVPPEYATPETFPKNLRQLDELADKITKKGPNGSLERAGYLPLNPGWWNFAWGPLFGGKLLDGEEPRIDTPEARKALNWIAGYTKRYGTQAVQNFQSGFGNFSSPQDPFMDGKVAAEMNGPWKASYIEVYRPGTKWFAVPFPYPEGREDLADHSPLSQDVLVIPRGAKHVKEAWEFVRYVQRQDVMEGLCMGHGKNSPLNKVSENFLQNHPNKAIRLFDRLARSSQGITMPRMGFFPQMNSELENAVQEVNSGVKKPEQALADAQVRVDSLWATYKSQVLGR